jgi:DNA-binding FadR family transcriptional regulator
VHDRVADVIGIAIVSGIHPPGTYLANEMEASESMKVSRTAYREAMRLLATKGLVSSRPKAGTRVNPRQDWIILDPDVLAWIFASEPSLKFIHSLFELRKIVEPAAAALAAERRTAEQLSRMGQALEEMGRHGLHSPEGGRADQAFHEYILEASDNEPLIGLSNSIAIAIRWTTIFKYRADKVPPDPMPAHRALYSAIADSDANAAQTAATVLIESAFEDTKRALKVFPT